MIKRNLLRYDSHKRFFSFYSDYLEVTVMERRFDWLWDKYKEGAREKLEEICRKIYKREYPNANVRRVRVTKGDGGIDVYIRNKDSFKIVQCKFFKKELGKSQKEQVTKSFETAMKNYSTEVDEWILSVPIIMSREEIFWWENWKEENEEKFNIIIDLHDEDNLIDLMKEHGLYDEYFETVRLDKNFFKSNAIDNEKAEIRKVIYPVVFLLKEGVTNFELIEEVDAISHWDSHKFFEGNGFFHYLRELSWYISINNNVPKPKDYDEKLLSLRKLALEEYQKLDLVYWR